jgi:hypothetical protein
MIILTTVVIESFIFTACYPCSKKVATQKWRRDTRANWIPIVYLIRLPAFLHVYFLLYCIVLYCIVLYCIVLYCIVLYCIVLYRGFGGQVVRALAFHL